MAADMAFDPGFAIGENSCVIVAKFLGAVLRADLKTKAGSLAYEHDVIKPAVDLLLDGI
jgi:hypothetical protein